MLVTVLAGCRGDIPFLHSEEEELTPGGAGNGSVKGFYLLNEGNMGSNKASLDFFSYETGKYMRNIYPSRNPESVIILIYECKLWLIFHFFADTLIPGSGHIRGICCYHIESHAVPRLE